MIEPSNSYRIYLATQPFDFRKGMDGSANYVVSNFELAHFSGAFFVFRATS
ncbi:IS66 family insertion sequence element accessory protein TnpB [Tritonibacter scottomollicae]|uniref:IS66 family insertion sequence element accessory protein TnpB n=1 Tax=Tritonibacter scottomollicae TaxID=483013 RepID=UPI003BAC63E2